MKKPYELKQRIKTSCTKREQELTDEINEHRAKIEANNAAIKDQYNRRFVQEPDFAIIEQLQADNKVRIAAMRTAKAELQGEWL